MWISELSVTSGKGAGLRDDESLKAIRLFGRQNDAKSNASAVPCSSVAFPLTPPSPSGRGRTIGRVEMKLESLLCSQHELNCSLPPRERARVRGNRATFGSWVRQLGELSSGVSPLAEPGLP
jgi:hypothetical protein